MIRTKNISPFLFGYRICSRKPPQPEMVAIVRGKFDLAPGQPVQPSRTELARFDLDDEAQAAELKEALDDAELVLGQGVLTADTFRDDDDSRTGYVVYPGDFAEYKLNAEVMLKGTCYPRKPTTQATVKLEVGKWSKSLTVTGHRAWVDGILGGKHTDPLPFESMPLDYSHAYGGPGFPANPSGTGHETEKLPNVEDPARPITRSSESPVPAGFGPINPEWPQRRSKVGQSYGPEYEKKYEPWYPGDFDWTYLHSAPADQQLKGYLKGGEQLRFCNLHPDTNDFSAEIPRHRPRVFVRMADGIQVEVDLVIDTLFVDLDEGALYLTWRGHTPVGEDDLSDIACTLVVNEDPNEKPRPRQEYFDMLAAYHADPTGMGGEDGDIAKLQRMHDKIESRELQMEVEAVPENDDVLVNIFDKVLAPVLPAEHVERMKVQMGSTLEGVSAKTPDVPRKIKDAVIKALDESLDPPSTGAGIGKDGEVTGSPAPIVKRHLAMLAKQQKEAQKHGADISEMDDELAKAVANIPDEKLRAELQAIDMAELRERAAEGVEPAPDRDCSGQDYSDRDFSGMDLHGINLEGAVLVRANLSGCNLEGAKLAAAALSRANLTGAKLKAADLTAAVLSRTQCREADFTGATLDHAILIRTDLTGAKLVDVGAHSMMATRAIFADAHIEDCTFFTVAFDNCDLERVRISKSSLERCMFRQCKLMNAMVDGAELTSCGFMESDLSHARFFQSGGERNSFHKAVLKDVDFSYSKFPASMFMNVSGRRANFYAADMPEVRFYRATLRDAVFEKANMFQADMRKTALTDTNFRGANLYSAQFTEAFGNDADFTKANIKLAVFKRNKLVRKGA